ncbi:MAG TPA: hypothetical protein VFF81_11335 [Noviherbaspirillum sp.]|nr:hypothetical protein [Noviherbaspirillum sp.]
MPFLIAWHFLNHHNEGHAKSGIVVLRSAWIAILACQLLGLRLRLLIQFLRCSMSIVRRLSLTLQQSEARTEAQTLTRIGLASTNVNNRLASHICKRSYAPKYDS